MIVIAHDGIGQEIDCEHFRQQDESTFNPVPAVAIISVVVGIFATEKSAANATHRTLIVGCVIEANLLTARYRHVEFTCSFTVTIATDTTQVFLY